MSAQGTLWEIFGKELANPADFEQIIHAVLRLLLVATLGVVFDYECKQSGKAVGPRTHMLVTLGAALLVMSLQLQGDGIDALSRMIQGTVAGIGFLCADTIPKAGREDRVRGPTTAVGLWADAVTGITVRFGHQGTAAFRAVLALLVLRVLAYLNRSPPSSNSH